jgi:hypothetical protein
MWYQVLLTLSSYVPVLSRDLGSHLPRCCVFSRLPRQVVYDFTINALKAQRDRPPLSDKEDQASQPSSASGNGNGNLSVTLRKGQVLHCPDRDWFGFGLLWHFIQVRPIRRFCLWLGGEAIHCLGRIRRIVRRKLHLQWSSQRRP